MLVHIKEKKNKEFCFDFEDTATIIGDDSGETIVRYLGGLMTGSVLSSQQMRRKLYSGGEGAFEKGAENDQHLPVALDKVYTDQEKKTPEPIKVLGNLFSNLLYYQSLQVYTLYRTDCVVLGYLRYIFAAASTGKQMQQSLPR